MFTHSEYCALSFSRSALWFLVLVVAFIILFSPHAHCADTGIEAPKAAHGTPPNLNNNVGDSRTINCFYYLPAATYQGSTLGSPNYSASVMPAQCVLQDPATGVFVCTNLQQATVSATCAATNSSASNSVAFTWQIGSANLLVANGYFVDCAGNDSNSGTDYLHPWLTTSKVNGFSFPTGADVWFKAGCTWQNQQLVWKGSGTGTLGVASDYAILGSYYVSGGIAYQNTPTNYTVSRRPSAYTYAVARPKIKGTYAQSCRQSVANGTTANKCAWNTASGNVNTEIPGTAVPTSMFGVMVTGIGAYQIIQDIEIDDSAGYAVSMGPAPPANAGFCFWDVRCDTFSILQRVLINGTAEDGIVMEGEHTIIRQNEILLTNLRRVDRPPGNSSLAFGRAMGPSACDPCYSLIEGNDLYGTGEAIGPYGVTFILVRGNWIGSSSRIGISFSNGGSIVAEQNIVVGGTADSIDPFDRVAGAGGPTLETGAIFWPFGYENGAPSAIACSQLYFRTQNGDECASKTVRRNNVAQSVSSGCYNEYLASNNGSQTQTKLGTQDVGNTCFFTSGTPSFVVDVEVGLESSFTSYHVFNNLIVGPGTCTMRSLSGVSYDYDQWAGSATTAPCIGAHDVNSANTGLGAFNWSLATWNNFPAESDFLPAASGAGNTAGNALSGAMFTYNDSLWGKADASTGLATWWSWVLAQRVWLPGCNTTGAQVPEVEWNKLLTTDYCGNPRSGGITLGARQAH